MPLENSIMMARVLSRIIRKQSNGTVLPLNRGLLPVRTTWVFAMKKGTA